MINPNELRFGNYVIIKNYNSKYWNKIGKIEGFSRNAEYVSLDINKYSAFYLKDIEPIPLKEILNKCDFVRCIGIEKEFILSSEDGVNYIHHQTGVVIKYLHELQNLWHAVRKKELQINL